jgi:levansucrase
MASAAHPASDGTVAVTDGAGLSASVWAAAHVASIADSPVPEAPILIAENVRRILPDIDLWDMWPLQNRDGSTSIIRDKGGEAGTLWMALSAPAYPDPGQRHGAARIRLLYSQGDVWHDCGAVMPDGLNPGSREWSGSAILGDDGQQITLFFTAAGRAGDGGSSYEQRLFQTRGLLDLSGNLPLISQWSSATESVVSDGETYVAVNQRDGVPGAIKAFRDPFWFRDPADGQSYILFTGSLAVSSSAYNGAVGIARALSSDGMADFTLMPPILHADELNNELERPHIIVKNGHYYLFWSTQRRTFNPDGPTGPNGLYGMVAPALFGPYVPLNGTGLVLANPADEPTQCYSWQVLDDLTVISFIDHWGIKGRDVGTDPILLRSNFGGTPAPFHHIALNGNRSQLLTR